jgi:hypothetical protein
LNIELNIDDEVKFFCFVLNAVCIDYPVAVVQHADEGSSIADVRVDGGQREETLEQGHYVGRDDQANT